MCNSKNKSIFVLIMVLCAILLSSCSEKDSNTVKSISFVDDEVTEYVDEHYGFASDPIYATYTSTPSRNGNSISFKNEIKLKEESKSGAIFYEKIKYKGNPNGLVCVYIDDENDVSLKVSYIEKYNDIDGNSSYTISIAKPTMKNRCYVTVLDDYLITVELNETSEGSVEGHYYLSYENDMDNLYSTWSNLYYEEKITVYEPDKDMNEKIQIVRKIDPRSKNELKTCRIEDENSTWVYAEGYDSYSYSGAKFISTEREFCDMANELLNNIAENFVSVSEDSWDSRWSGISVDERRLIKDMVKVDFITSYGIIDESNNVTSDIEITVNHRLEELPEDIRKEEDQHEKIQDEEAENNSITNSSNEDYSKLLKGDFSDFTGVYKTPSGASMTLLPNGMDESYKGNIEYEFRVENIKKETNGSYSWDILTYDNGSVMDGVACILYPKGVDVIAWDGNVVNTDTSKIRLWCGNGSVSEAEYIYYKQ